MMLQTEIVLLSHSWRANKIKKRKRIFSKICGKMLSAAFALDFQDNYKEEPMFNKMQILYHE